MISEILMTYNNNETESRISLNTFIVVSPLSGLKITIQQNQEIPREDSVQK